ncbi:hypothetical protein BGW38_003788 [Lunasporangiospora selenospora]|uniref:Uncharacterized protein n=1 Tax=Lunasporangiospora selenospora TaxID=979761 RepID=A0A9P6KCG8_9FUNG|nr:hypothetical protein BGW38_003788 [Lunasporangiospora selenospora]
MSDEFENRFKQTLRLPVPPTPAHFSKQFAFASKQEAGSMYCRLFQRAQRSDNTKSKGEKMQALWEDRKHRDAFDSYWSTKQGKYKKSMNTIDSTLAVRTRSMVAGMMGGVAKSVGQSVVSLNAPQQANLRDSVSSTKTEVTETTDSTSSYFYQSEQESESEDDSKRQRKRLRKEPTRWDGSGSFDLTVNKRWIHDGNDMSSPLLGYAELYLEVGTDCPDRPAKVAMNRIFFLESNTTLAAHLSTAGSFLFIPVPHPHLAPQDVMDIYDISGAFREKDSILVQDYIFSEWAKNRPPSDLLRRLVTNYAQVEALWTRPNDQNEDTYLHDYFMPIFNCLQHPGFTRHLTSTFRPSLIRSRAFDPANLGIKSDLHLVTKGTHVFVCEGKKPVVSSKFDFEKIALEMKDSIDDAITNGKRLERVFGCQVKGDQGELFSMDLQAESIYLMRPIGSFVRPKNHTDMLHVLLTNLPILQWLSQELQISFNTLDKDAHDLKAWIRPSFELPRCWSPQLASQK